MFLSLSRLRLKRSKKMSLIEDFSKEVMGAIVLGFLAVIFIAILATFGETTGQTEITNSVITAILIALGIGIPVGIILIIKWLGDQYG